MIELYLIGAFDDIAFCLLEAFIKLSDSMIKLIKKEWKSWKKMIKVRKEALSLRLKLTKENLLWARWMSNLLSWVDLSKQNSDRVAYSYHASYKHSGSFSRANQLC